MTRIYKVDCLGGDIDINIDKIVAIGDFEIYTGCIESGTYVLYMDGGRTLVIHSKNYHREELLDIWRSFYD